MMSKSRGKVRSSKQQGREELARKLREWALGDMGLLERGDTLPSQEELQLLLRGNLSNAWEHITAHVCAPSTVGFVRRNLLLHSAGGGGGEGVEGERLHVRKAELAQELSSLRLAVAQLEADAGRLQNDITRRVGENIKTKAALAELSRKAVMLSAHSIKCKETVRVLKEYTRRIHQRRELFRHFPGETSYFARSSAPPLPDLNSKTVVLESACTREVRQACNQLEVVVRLLSTQKGGQRPEQLERAQEQTWSKIESLLCQFSPQEILNSLTEVTREGGGEIRQHTAAIDLSRDAEQLKYQVDPSGGMRDVAETPSLLHSVKEHLLEAQLSHIRRSVEAERAQKGATEAQQRLSEVKGRLEQLLSAQYGSDAVGLELARSHLGLELEEAGCSAALQALSSLCSGLSSSRDQRRTAIDQLHEKHRRIAKFAQAAHIDYIRFVLDTGVLSHTHTPPQEARQGQIGILVKLNSSARDRLQKQKTEQELYVRGNVCSHEAELVCLADSLRDGMHREVQLFSTLSLTRLMKPPGLSAPVCELSVCRLSPVQPSGAPSWEGLLRALELPSHSAPEEVLPRLSELLRKVEAVRVEVAASEQELQETKGRSMNREHAECTLAAVQQYDRQQAEETLPALKQCLSQAAQGMAKCTTVQQTLQEWWAQPAAGLTPWVTYEGMDIQQWVQQWRVLTTKLRHLSASKQQ